MNSAEEVSERAGIFLREVARRNDDLPAGSGLPCSRKSLLA